MKIRYVVALAGAALVVGAFVGVGIPQGAHAVTAEETSRYITVSGTGAVVVIPDRVALSFGVNTRGDTAVAALTANSASMRKLIAALKAAGIAAKDIQTTQLSVSPEYDDEERNILGYEASNGVSVNVRNVELAGALIDAAVKAGANEVDGPTLYRSNGEDLARQALRDAVADARKNAEAIAAAAGVALGKVLTVNVNEATPVYRAKSLEAPAPAADTPIEPGSQDIQATVSVTFEVA